MSKVFCIFEITQATYFLLLDLLVKLCVLCCWIYMIISRCVYFTDLSEKA